MKKFLLSLVFVSTFSLFTNCPDDIDIVPLDNTECKCDGTTCVVSHFNS